jgi:hypothetical protein
MNYFTRRLFIFAIIMTLVSSYTSAQEMFPLEKNEREYVKIIQSPQYCNNVKDILARHNPFMNCSFLVIGTIYLAHPEMRDFLLMLANENLGETKTTYDARVLKFFSTLKKCYGGMNSPNIIVYDKQQAVQQLSRLMLGGTCKSLTPDSKGIYPPDDTLKGFVDTLTKYYKEVPCGFEANIKTPDLLDPTFQSMATRLTTIRYSIASVNADGTTTLVEEVSDEEYATRYHSIDFTDYAKATAYKVEGKVIHGRCEKSFSFKIGGDTTPCDQTKLRMEVNDAISLFSNVNINLKYKVFIKGTTTLAMQGEFSSIENHIIDGLYLKQGQLYDVKISAVNSRYPWCPEIKIEKEIGNISNCDPNLKVNVSDVLTLDSSLPLNLKYKIIAKDSNQVIKEAQINEFTHQVIDGLNLKDGRLYYLQVSGTSPYDWCPEVFINQEIGEAAKCDSNINLEISDVIDFESDLPQDVEYKIFSKATNELVKRGKLSNIKVKTIDRLNLKEGVPYVLQLTSKNANSPWCPENSFNRDFIIDENTEPSIRAHWKCDKYDTDDKSKYEIVSFIDGEKKNDGKVHLAANNPNNSFYMEWGNASSQGYTPYFDSPIPINHFFAVSYDLKKYQGRILCAAIKVRGVGNFADGYEAWSDSLLAYIRPYDHIFTQDDFAEAAKPGNKSFIFPDQAQLKITSEEFKNTAGCWVEKTDKGEKNFVGIMDFNKYERIKTSAGGVTSFIRQMNASDGLHFMFQDDSSVDYFELMLLIRK